jgi:hypothetical protein
MLAYHDRTLYFDRTFGLPGYHFNYLNTLDSGLAENLITLRVASLPDIEMMDLGQESKVEREITRKRRT